VKSRVSRTSKFSNGSGTQGFKAKFMKKMEDQNDAAKAAAEDKISEHTYESD
jgi:hypothetical protein